MGMPCSNCCNRNPFGYQPWREKRTFDAMFDILEADIVVMQETKIQRKDLQDDMVLVPGWDVYFSLPKHKKGTATISDAALSVLSFNDEYRIRRCRNLHTKCDMYSN